MKVTIIQNCSYSPDKVNEKKLIAGEVCELPDRIANAFIGHGYCKPFKNNAPEKVYTPVKETAVVNPVKEVKTKPRRKSRKKAE